MSSRTPSPIGSFSPDASIDVPPAVIRPSTDSYPYSMSGVTPESYTISRGTPLMSRPSYVQPTINTSDYGPSIPRVMTNTPVDYERTATPIVTPNIGTPQSRNIPDPGTVTRTTTRQPVTYNQPGIQRSTVREPALYPQTGTRETTYSGSGIHETVVREPVTINRPGVRETIIDEPVEIPQQAVLETTTSSRLVPAGPPPPPNQPPASKSDSYLDTPDDCHPLRQPYKCPIMIYAILILILILVNIWAIFRAPKFDNFGRPISTGTVWLASIVGIVFMLVFGLFFGWWIMQRCKSCDNSSLNHGVNFALALGVPIVLGLLTGLIIGSIMGVGLLWTASRAPNPTSSNIC